VTSLVPWLDGEWVSPMLADDLVIEVSLRACRVLVELDWFDGKVWATADCEEAADA